MQLLLLPGLLQQSYTAVTAQTSLNAVNAPNIALNSSLTAAVTALAILTGVIALIPQ